MAEYVTDDQLRKLGIARDAFLERDSTFIINRHPLSAQPLQETQSIIADPVKVELLKVRQIDVLFLRHTKAL